MRDHGRFPRLLALGATFAFIAAQPCAALSGRVVWRGQQTAVAKAEVIVLGRTQVAKTNVDGHFTLTPSPQPPFEVLVVLANGTYMRPVLIEAIPASGTLFVEVEPILAEAMTVVAGATASVESTPAAGTTVVPGVELQRRQATNLAQALENVPGVASVSEGQAAVPAIRGLAQGRSLILIDDARVTSERRAGPSATYLDPFVLDAVEVVRGPGSVAYGSDAFGGVILARTRGPEPGAQLRARAIATVGVGTPQQRIGAEVTTGIGTHTGVLLSVHHREQDDYASPRGDVFNSGSRDQGFLARMTRIVGAGTLSIGWQSDFGRDIERPRTNSRSVRFYYPTEDSHRLNAAWSPGSLLGLNTLELTGFVGGYSAVTDQDQYATATTSRAIARSEVRAKDFSFRVVGEKLLAETRVEMGVDVNGRFGLTADDVAMTFDLSGAMTSRAVTETIGDARRVDTGLFVEAERAVASRVLVSAGGRFDFVASTNHGGYFGNRSVSTNAGSGFAAITFGSFRGFTLTGQVARGFRDARLSDRYFRGVTGRGFITGNPDLGPETSRQFDVALRYSAARWRLGLFGYEYRFSDLIERYEDGPDLFFFRNQAQARIRGVELEAHVQLGRGVEAELAVASSSGESPKDGQPLDDIAPPTVSLQLRKQVGGRGFVQLRGALYDADDEAGPTEVATPGYGILDATAGYKLSDGLELRLLGRNLLDKAYPLSSDGRSPVAPGASAVATVEVSF